MSLQAIGAGKKFDGRWIFRSISFDLQAGQALLVLGPNGIGKSSLLKLMAGLLTPSEGHVVRPEPAHLKVGYFSLDGRVYAALTVAEQIEMAGRLRGIDARTDYWLDRIGLKSARDRMGSQLSTGMRSRLKLALAAQAEPEVLILDEPGAGLDDAGRDLVGGICEDQLRRGCLLIATNDPFERRFATHEMELG